MGRFSCSLVSLAPALLLGVTARAQAARPWLPGESAVYDVHYGPVHAGTATLNVVGIDNVRGHTAYHVLLSVRGGVNLLVYKYDLRDTLESWVDTATLNSLRFTQRQWHRGRLRSKHYELFPERQTFVDGDQGEQASVVNPLDDLGVLYLARSLPLEVGKSVEIARYFKPPANPVVLRVLGRDTIEAAGRRWSTLVVQPIIKTSTMFGDGQARVWLSDDSARVIVRLNAKASIGSITMTLRSLSHRSESVPRDASAPASAT
jgi:hypothetical protein